MITTTAIRRTAVAGLIAAAALGVTAGVAAADTRNQGARDNAASVCDIGAGDVLVVDDDPNGYTTCYQKTITTSCNPTDCIVITDDPRLSKRTTGSRTHVARSAS